ncbi:MAG TPA: PIN domain-containing protein [Acidobacteriota bacterium]|nr:PIN domain-containing protein [Acidobacteriota bacterium]
MPEFMLGTDTVSYALRGQRGVAERILAHRPSQLCISSITLAELRYGADLRNSKKLHRLIDAFVESIEVLPFTTSAADKFPVVAFALTKRGEPIGTFDTLLAAHALSLGTTFVTNDLRHFSRVPELSSESWAG